jgi:radical SAM family uncharacterized protein/radical SAM-linked protein
MKLQVKVKDDKKPAPPEAVGEGDRQLLIDRDDILMEVEKPARYLGGEAGPARKPEGGLKFLLAFPDTYEVGMSHLGLKILYGILASLPDVAVDRAFAPWVDLETRLRQERLPLWGLDSRRPLKDFDVVGFSLQYELSYTNLLNMLDLGGIPLERTARGEGVPLVIAGGPGAFNPAPLEDFIDAFVIGEGEEVIREICAVLVAGKRKKWKRRDLLAALAEIEGLYLPAAQDSPRPVRKRIVTNLEEAFFPVDPLIPLMQTIHDRAVVEIRRGCTRGCRFCQAGMVWRPGRERSLAKIVNQAESLLACTGYEALSLLALSAGDYRHIEELLAVLMERLGPRKIALALPSLRVETLSRRMIDEIRQVRKTSFTLAPEAGTQSLRNAINKGNSDADLLETAAAVFDSGWLALKLYFMIGLPGEKPEDREGIVDLSHRVARQARPRGQVTVSLSTFSPKPHTPFQWADQLPPALTREYQDYFRRHLKGRNLVLRWHDWRMSLLEGLISRGEAPIGRVIKSAFELGARFDGWSEKLRFDLWQEALAREKIDLEGCLRGKPTHAPLPWDGIDTGLTGSFLESELARAQEGVLTPDCRTGSCRNCGVCPRLKAEVGIAPGGEKPPPPLEDLRSEGGGREITCRLIYGKQGRMRFLSHLETSSALIRALKRAKVSFVFSRGFHPHPLVSFGPAGFVGMESAGEYADLVIKEPAEGLEEIKTRANACLPDGLKILQIKPLAPGARSLAEIMTGFCYEMFPVPGKHRQEVAEKIAAFLERESYLVERITPRGKKIKDIRPRVISLVLIEEGSKIELQVTVGPEGSVRPGEILTQVLGLTAATALGMRMVKTNSLFKDDSPGG